MKTIELSDEMYDKLISLATEMTSQNPRGTKMPHIFQIRDWKKTYDSGLNGDTFFWYDDYREIETLDEFKDYLEEHHTPIPENIEDIWSCVYNMDDFIKSNNIGLKVCSYSLEPVYHNHFLTAKAAEEHLKNNYYHYHKDADVYLNHAWRNPEMETISTFLCNLIGKEMYS